MTNLKEYLKYYWLEREYFEKEVRPFFDKEHYLKPEHFFSIVIWKRAASKTRIKDSFIKENKTIEDITSNIFKYKNDRQKQLDLLTDIEQVGISIASAILSVCFPDDFTIVDIRACSALRRNPFNISNFPYDKFVSKNDVSKKLYFQYVDKCKELAKHEGFSLRDFDRVLFGKDLYDEEKTGLRVLVDKYNRKEMELEKSKPEKVM